MTTDAKLRRLLNRQRPTTVLKKLAHKPWSRLGIYWAEALLQLDRSKEAHEYLEALLPRLDGEDRIEAELVWGKTLLISNKVDAAILTLREAIDAKQDDDFRAHALSHVARCYARKQCWASAESTLREAIELDPNSISVLLSQAYVRLLADQRLAALAAYERLATLKDPEARFFANWGRSHITYLLGEFDQSRKLAQAALRYSRETVAPLYNLALVELTEQNLPALKRTVAQIEKRSPKAETLDQIQEELARLKARLSPETQEARYRLAAFPTTVQRRDYCGPSTIELVLRYWKDGLDLTNDQIAQKVKDPCGGTPTYRVKDFFRLVGFDTLSCTVPAAKLKTLVKAGYPIIIEVEFPQNSHLTVVIGYDDAAGEIELQDPATHNVVSLPVGELDELRQIYSDTAIIPFPLGQGHEKRLARMGFFDDPLLALMDQAGLASHEGRFKEASELLEHVTQKRPSYVLGWSLRLHTEFNLWSAVRGTPSTELSPLAQRVQNTLDTQEDAPTARGRFYDVLTRLQQTHPTAKTTHWFIGIGAALDGDWEQALAAYERAVEIDDQDPRLLASLAESYYKMQDPDQAGETCQKALEIDPASPVANVWMALSLDGAQHPHLSHYARAAAELAPDWWITHIALAKALLVERDYRAAVNECGLAMTLSRDAPEARILKAQLMSMGKEPVSAITEIEAALNSPIPLSPHATYEAYQSLCRILFGHQVFDAAVEQVHTMLAAFPDDPWALQFLADAYANGIIHHQIEAEEKSDGTPDQVTEIRRFYERAIEANPGIPWIVSNYLNQLASVADVESAIRAVEDLKAIYPDRGYLHFMHGHLLNRAEAYQASAQAMLQALEHADGIADVDELYQAIYTIVEGLGSEQGRRAILETPVPREGAPMKDRKRALGLVLAREAECPAEARALLTEVLRDNPEDAFATLRMGEIAPSETKREALYRRAVMLAPGWSYGRMTLADYLIDHSRYNEALDITAGHEQDSPLVLASHGYALLGLGHTEDAALTFEKASQAFDQPDLQLYQVRWHAEEESGWHQKALATAQEGMELFTDESTWTVRAAKSLCRLKRFDEAIDVVEEGKRHGLPEEDALRAEYEIAFMKQDYERALEIVDRLIEYHDEKPQGRLGFWTDKRLKLLAKLNDLDAARQLVEAANLDADGWGHAAWTVMYGNQAHELTLEFAERSLVLDPKNFAGLYARAEGLIDLGREEEALATLEQLRHAHPNEHNAYELLALRFAVAEEMDEALRLAERALALGAFCWAAWATRGYVHFVRGEHAEAKQDLETAWNRADDEMRADYHHFWWVLATLQEKEERSQACRQRAIEEAETDFARQVIAQITGRIDRGETTQG